MRGTVGAAGTIVWAAASNEGEKGAPGGCNTVATSIRFGERELKVGELELLSPPHVPCGSPTPWVSPCVILHYSQPTFPPLDTFNNAK